MFLNPQPLHSHMFKSPTVNILLTIATKLQKKIDICGQTTSYVFVQAHQLVEAQKRKAVDKNNPTLYWEYKWAEDAEAEVLVNASMQFKYWYL